MNTENKENWFPTQQLWREDLTESLGACIESGTFRKRVKENWFRDNILALQNT